MRIGVLNNLNAGARGARAATVSRFLETRRDVACVNTADAAGVREGLAGLAAQGVDVLVVNGGDGTMARALTEILEHDLFEKLPLVAPLRCGRTNMNAADLGCSRDPMQALAWLMAAARSGSLAARYVHRPVLRADLGPQDGIHYGMFCGLGVIPRAIRLTHRRFPQGRAQGALGSGVTTAVLATRLVLGSATDILAPDTMHITLDGEPVAATSFRVVIASALERVFLKLRPFWGAEAAPIHFTALRADHSRRPSALVNVLRGRLPTPTAVADGFLSRNVRELVVEHDCALTVDGEIFEAAPGRRLRMTADERIQFVAA